jgi:hypothetical protein
MKQAYYKEDREENIFKNKRKKEWEWKDDEYDEDFLEF